jgi:hypothetical protein
MSADRDSSEGIGGMVAEVLWMGEWAWELPMQRELELEQHLCCVSRLTKFRFSSHTHVALLTLAQARLSLRPGFCSGLLDRDGLVAWRLVPCLRLIDGAVEIVH